MMKKIFNQFHIMNESFEYRQDGTIIILKSGVANIRGDSLAVFIGDIIDVEKMTINSIPIDQYKMRRSLDRFMFKGTHETDPYWDLFKVKDQVNDALVKAVQYGYEKGYTAAKGEII